MKKILTSTLALLLFVGASVAQKVSYKDETISVDGTAIGKIKSTKSKDGGGFVKDFEVTAMDGTSLIKAIYDVSIPENPNDNTVWYYNFTFVGTEFTAYFLLNKMGTDKSLANLVGKNALIKGNALDPQAVKNCIAKNGKTPPAKAVDYTIVNRDRSWPIEIRKPGEILQQSKVIATYKDVTLPNAVAGTSSYAFYLPSGVQIAIVSFRDGNNAQSFEVETMKDKKRQNVASPVEKTKTLMEVDKNAAVLERIAKWLVANQYL